MAKNPEGELSSIINMSSVAGLVGMAPFIAYSATKGAVTLLTKSIAHHCLEKGYSIRCNSVHPSGIVTPMTVNLGVAEAPVHGPERMGQPEDVAYMVLYLASDESQFVNGAEFAVDNAFTAI